LRRVETGHLIEQELPNKSTPSTYGAEINTPAERIATLDNDTLYVV
jgi:hypothetical protein